MPADGLAIQGAGTSVTIISTWFAQNVPVSVPVEWTHWGRVTHKCVGNLTIIGSDNGLSPGRCQAITWTNVEILLIVNRNSYIFIQENPFENVVFEMASNFSRPRCDKWQILDINGLFISIEIYQQVTTTGPHWWLASIRLGNGLVP